MESDIDRQKRLDDEALKRDQEIDRAGVKPKRVTATPSMGNRPDLANRADIQAGPDQSGQYGDDRDPATIERDEVGRPVMPIPRVRPLTSADIDAQGKVVVWDHGPLEPMVDGKPVDHDSDEYRRYEAERDEWRYTHYRNRRADDTTPYAPVPLIMFAVDASHALAVEPARYSLEPLGEDADELNNRVEARLKEIQESRVQAQRFADERQGRIAFDMDRKQAIADVMAEQRAERDAAARAKPDPRRPLAARDPAADTKDFD